jgi:hypothetical protein
MDLREARECSQFTKSFTATKLNCTSHKQHIKISSELGCVIELYGVVERHSEWNDTWDDEDEMPLSNINFHCEVTSEKGGVGVDEEGDAIAAQVLYQTAEGECNAKIKISIWEKDDTFKHLLKMTQDSLKDNNIGIAINLSTNVSFCELIESKEISEKWQPMNAWDFYFYNKNNSILQG